MNQYFRKLARPLSRLLPRLAYPILVGPLCGYRFVLGSLAGAGGGASVYLNLVEPEQTEAINKRLAPGDVFFDIGANVGYYTLLASRRVGSTGFVCAFEPLVRNVYYLHRHLSFNKVNNCLIISAACGEQSDQLALFEYGDNIATGHVVTSHGTLGFSLIEQAVVPVTTVDEVSKKLSVLPNVMKIDVEGAELAVLKGAQNVLRSAKPDIFLSVHSSELRLLCSAYLKDLGYRLEPLDKDKSEPAEFFAYHA